MRKPRRKKAVRLSKCTTALDRRAHGVPGTHFRESTFARQVHFHFDDGPAERKLDLGVLLTTPAAGVHLYVCGPRGFKDAVLGTARASKWPEEQLHYEFFSAGPSNSHSDDTFRVQLASSGRIVVDVNPVRLEHTHCTMQLVGQIVSGSNPHVPSNRWSVWCTPGCTPRRWTIARLRIEAARRVFFDSAPGNPTPGQSEPNHSLALR